MSDGLPVTAGAAIFRRLHRLGVDRVFVNSGTDFPPIIEGLAEGEAHGAALPLSIVVPHEHVAVSMAHGHFFATGRPAAVILHTNVGLANGAIGAINAATDHVPMILMSGRTPATETRPLRLAHRADRLGSGDARPGGARPRGVQVGLRSALPRAGTRAARPRLRDRHEHAEGTGVSEPAA